MNLYNDYDYQVVKSRHELDLWSIPLPNLDPLNLAKENLFPNLQPSKKFKTQIFTRIDHEATRIKIRRMLNKINTDNITVAIKTAIERGYLNAVQVSKFMEIESQRLMKQKKIKPNN